MSGSLTVAFQNGTSLYGNQGDFSGALGMDFTVNTASVFVYDLGAFDDGQATMAASVTVGLYDVTTEQLISQLITLSGTAGTQIGSSRFETLADPLLLNPGTYSVVAWGYDSAMPEYDQGLGASGLISTNSDDGAISFVGTGRYGDAGAFPTTVNTGTVANAFAAGTFLFDQGVLVDVSSEAQLNAGIAAINVGGTEAAANGGYVIDIVQGFAIDGSVTPIDLEGTSSLTIEGAGLTGAGSLVVGGAGSVTLDSVNSFGGGVTLQGGSLELAAGASIGSGDIDLTGPNVTLKLDGAILPSNTILGFGIGDTIDFAGLNVTSALETSGNVMVLQLANGGTAALQLPGVDRLPVVQSDGNGGTDLELVPSNTFEVGSQAGLAAAIQTIGTGTAGGQYTIDLTTNITLSADRPAIFLAAGSDDLTFLGNGYTIDGANTYRGLMVLGYGTATLQDLTIQNAVARGGNGGSGRLAGGGGAGMGGGLFIGSGADIRQSEDIVSSVGRSYAGPSVTLDNVQLLDDSAIGGAGGNGNPSAGQYSSGGGGLGGAGGSASGYGGLCGGGGYAQFPAALNYGPGNFLYVGAGGGATRLTPAHIPAKSAALVVLAAVVAAAAAMTAGPGLWAAAAAPQIN